MRFHKKIIDFFYHFYWSSPINDGLKDSIHQLYRRLMNGSVWKYLFQITKKDENLDLYLAFKNAVRTVIPYDEITGELIKSDQAPYLLAYYLPQFYPTKENNEWWGPGVTEWNNVTRSLPQFVGHIQPRIPADLGYYDLRNDEVLIKQSEFAAQYGISAFSVYFYWFGGNKRLLNIPLDKFSKLTALKTKFCLCWANESWTKRFDGISSDILMQQDHSYDTYIKFIEIAEAYLESGNYFCLNEKPVIIIYRPHHIPEVKKILNHWRYYIRSKYKIDLHLVAVKDPFIDTCWIGLGFDAETSFQPAQVRSHQATIHGNINFLNTKFAGKIYDYSDIISNKYYLRVPSRNYHHAVSCGWDNSPRRESSGLIYTNSNPENYRNWLCDAIKLSKEQNSQLVFLNAWNEWGEGAYLEPDHYHGIAFLKATKDAINLSNVSL